jgi:acyl-CoA reductase-like NAD-dependent aldehyde dehydrogenase
MTAEHSNSLRREVLQRDSIYMSSAWRSPRSHVRTEVISPSTEAVVGYAPDVNAADVDDAVQAARRAFDGGAWSGAPIAERIALLERARQAQEPKLGEIATLVSTEMGLPITTARQLVPGALATGRYFLGLAPSLVLQELRRGEHTAAVLREPVGVVASIAPWYGPFNLALAKIIPALVSGCTVVFKPAPETPLDVYYFAEALAAVGLPPGVFNLLTGGREAGRALVAHPAVNKVSFTGSTAAGRENGAECGRSFKRMRLELGGKSAAIIAADADLTVTMGGLAVGSFSNSGQICPAFSRVLAPRFPLHRNHRHPVRDRGRVQARRSLRRIFNARSAGFCAAARARRGMHCLGSAGRRAALVRWRQACRTPKGLVRRADSVCRCRQPHADRA